MCINIYIYLTYLYLYFQMVGQKPCQNSVSGWGSLEVFRFFAFDPLVTWLKSYQKVTWLFINEVTHRIHRIPPVWFHCDLRGPFSDKPTRIDTHEKEAVAFFCAPEYCNRCGIQHWTCARRRGHFETSMSMHVICFCPSELPYLEVSKKLGGPPKSSMEKWYPL